jgi:NLS-binding and DNA-binding and dimerisation domains of Nrf1
VCKKAKINVCSQIPDFTKWCFSQVRNLRSVIMQELETALAQQAPPPVQEDPSLYELPPLVIDGIPTPVEKMTQAQLRAFIPLMLKYSTGEFLFLIFFRSLRFVGVSASFYKLFYFLKIQAVASQVGGRNRRGRHGGRKTCPGQMLEWTRGLRRRSRKYASDSRPLWRSSMFRQIFRSPGPTLCVR